MLLRQKPVLCNYYVTYRCNAKCSFCDIWEKPSPYVTEIDVLSNLKDLKKLGVKVIDFTGGEPLLHRQLANFCQMAKKMGFITTVTTNTLLYPKYGHSLRGLVDMLHFSLDSPVENEHNQSRGVACFSTFMESLDLAASWGERPDILFTVTPDSIRQIQEVYQKISLPRKLMLILNPVFSYGDIGQELSQNDLKSLRKWGQKKGIYLNQAFVTLREKGGNIPERPVCRAGTSTVVISPDNKLVLPCYHLGILELPIDGNLFQLRNSETVQKGISMEGRMEKCRGCTINCYMQPSFAVELSSFWLEAVPSTLKYNLYKGTWKEILPSFNKKIDVTQR